MKNLLLNILFLTALGPGVGLAQNPQKVLIVYYSRSGNTEALAEQIRAATEGVIFRIETVDAYPKEYHATTEQAKKEINAGYLPPIRGSVEDIRDYDVVFIGSPCWWGTLAPPVSTFLAEHDLAGKTLVPFVTHEGSGMAQCTEVLRKACPASRVLDGLAVRGSRVQQAQQDVLNWIERLPLPPEG